MPEQIQNQRTSEHIDLLTQTMDSGSLAQTKSLLNSLHPSQVADLLESMPRSQRLLVWELVDHAQDGEILIEVGEEVRRSLMREMEPEDLLDALEKMDTDDMADVLQSLPEALLDKTLRSMKRLDRERVEAVLAYPEGTAGALMNTDTVTIRPNVTLEVVRRYLKKLGKLPNGADRVYVVDYFNKFLGTLYFSSLLTAKSSEIVANVMDTSVTTVTADEKEDKVVRFFEDRDLVSVPVVDDQNHLIGRITIDDVVDIIREDADKAMMSHAGLSEEEDIFAPIIKSTQRRAIWLGTNLMTAFLAAWVIGLFEATIDKIVALAVLLPIVASMGGIAGTQTLTLVVRAQALGQLGAGNTRSLLTKEIAIGSLNGIIWALVVAVVASLWFSNAAIGATIGAALVINLITAAGAGVIVPVIMNKINIDAALAGGVVLTTVTDVVGFLSFLGIATLVLL